MSRLDSVHMVTIETKGHSNELICCLTSLDPRIIFASPQLVSKSSRVPR